MRTFVRGLTAAAKSTKVAKSDRTTISLPPDTFRTHNCPQPALGVPVGREQLVAQLQQMMTIRRMEMAADALYKERAIRGFCHLAIGQEAVPVGLEASLGAADCIITAYRCHGFALLRGASVHQIIAELLGKSTGVSRGKGGSMHMFADRFYGGNGIVGAQVPLGAGVAFAQQYLKQDAATFALYGDGAANQGQVFEAFNMAALWKLPVVFVCENNMYSMGTSAERSTAATEYYKRAGDMLPGLKANGMDMLAVQAAGKYCRDHAIKHGPIILELQTYRYQGHSMSDPGTGYRTREEVQKVRSERDPIKQVQSVLQDLKWMTEDAVKDLEKDVRRAVDAQVEQARADPEPAVQDLWSDIYTPNPSNALKRGCLHYSL